MLTPALTQKLAFVIIQIFIELKKINIEIFYKKKYPAKLYLTFGIAIYTYLYISTYTEGQLWCKEKQALAISPNANFTEILIFRLIYLYIYGENCLHLRSFSSIPIFLI